MSDNNYTTPTHTIYGQTLNLVSDTVLQVNYMPINKYLDWVADAVDDGVPADPNNKDDDAPVDEGKTDTGSQTGNPATSQGNDGKPNTDTGSEVDAINDPHGVIEYEYNFSVAAFGPFDQPGSSPTVPTGWFWNATLWKRGREITLRVVNQDAKPAIQNSLLFLNLFPFKQLIVAAYLKKKASAVTSQEVDTYWPYYGQLFWPNTQAVTDQILCFDGRAYPEPRWRPGQWFLNPITQENTTFDQLDPPLTKPHSDPRREDMRIAFLFGFFITPGFLLDDPEIGQNGQPYAISNQASVYQDIQTGDKAILTSLLTAGTQFPAIFRWNSALAVLDPNTTPPTLPTTST